MAKLAQEGKVRFLGVSNFNVGQIDYQIQYYSNRHKRIGQGRTGQTQKRKDRRRAKLSLRRRIYIYRYGAEYRLFERICGLDRERIYQVRLCVSSHKRPGRVRSQRLQSWCGYAVGHSGR